MAAIAVRALAVVVGTIVLAPALTMLMTGLLMLLGVFEQTEEGVTLYLCTFPITFVALVVIVLWSRHGAA